MSGASMRFFPGHIVTTRFDGEVTIIPTAHIQLIEVVPPPDEAPDILWTVRIYHPAGHVEVSGVPEDQAAIVQGRYAASLNRDPQ